MFDRVRGSASRLATRLAESLLLLEAETRARSYSDEQRAQLAVLYEAARVRARAARDLRDSTRLGPAGGLYRDATLIAGRAVLVASHPQTAAFTADRTTVTRALQA